MKRLIIWLSGASPDILRRCPTDRERYFALGASVLIAAAAAGVSLATALRISIGLSLAVAILVAVAYSFIVLSIDRLLVVSLRRRGRTPGTLLQAIPGIAFGIVLGVTVATPITLQIFQSEIQPQIRTIQSAALNSYYVNLAASPLSKKIASERDTVAALEEAIASGTNQFRDPTVQSLTEQLDQAQKQAQAAFDEWQCELYGQPGGHCSGATGNGPLAAADHQRYLNDANVVSVDNARLLSTEQQIAANNRTQQIEALTQAQHSLQTDLDEQSQLTASFLNANKGNTGLLVQLQALGDLASQNGAVNAARWLLTALFALIFLLPVLVKTLFNLGPESTYEKMLTLEEHLQLQLAREVAIRRQEAELKELDDVISKTSRALSEHQDPKADEL